MAGIQLPSESVHQHNDLNSSSIGDNHDSSSSSINIHPEIDHHTIIESVRKHFEVKEREGVIFYLFIHTEPTFYRSNHPFIHYLSIYSSVYRSIHPYIHPFIHISIHMSILLLSIHPSAHLSIHQSIHPPDPFPHNNHTFVHHPSYSSSTYLSIYPSPSPLHDKSIYVDIFKISYTSKDELRHVNFELKGQYYLTLNLCFHHSKGG